MTRKRAIKYLMGVAHFDRNTIQKAFADTHKKVPGSSNVQIAAILLENWEDAAIAAHNINFRAAVVVKRFNLEIYHEKELHENPAVRKRPLDDDGKNGYTGRRTAGSAAHTALHFTMCRDGALSCSGITAPGASSVLTIATKGGERYDPPRLGAGSGNQLYSSQHSGRDHQTLVKKEQCKSILSISRNALRGRHCEMTYTV